MKRKIPLFKIYWDKEDVKYISMCISSGISWAEGPSIEEFENRIGRYIGAKYSVVFNSGTSALYAILLAYGIKGQDEIIVPSFTFIATANAPLFVGATPVFADIEEETFGLDPKDVKEKITSKTKAIIAVHYGGCPCKIKELKKIAEEYNLILIEDAAEAFGAKIEERKVGTFGDSAIFSFCQNKIITTGEGGAIVTNSQRIYKRLKLIRSYGRLNGNGYSSSTKALDYTTLGFNFRMPTFVAALGIAQLRKIDRIINMRRLNAKYLTWRLNQETTEVVTLSSPRGYLSVYQLYSVRVSRYRDKLIEYLAQKGITTKIYFTPVHLTHFYKRKLGKRYKLPVTESISKQILTLPMYPTLSRQEMEYIAECIKIFFTDAELKNR